MRLFTVFFMLISFSASTQTLQVMDFVKIKDGHTTEAVFYYEHNWKLFRDSALQKGYIQSYRVELVVADTAAFDLVLITEYKDSLQYSYSENNFREIIAALRPDGPLLINKLQPADFRQNLFVKISRNLFRSYPLRLVDGNPGHQE